MRIPLPGVSLQNNRYTGLSGFPDAESGSSTGNAGFAIGGYQLDTASSGRDAGAFFVPQLQGTLDPAGEQRVQGSAVDLGALEFPVVFRNGFEAH